VWLRSTFHCVRRCSLSAFTKFHVGVGRGCSSNVVARRAAQIFLPVMELEPGRFSINVTNLTELALMSAAWYGTDYASNGISVDVLWLIVQKTHTDGRALCRPPHSVQTCGELYNCNAGGEVYLHFEVFLTSYIAYVTRFTELISSKMYCNYKFLPNRH